MTAKTDRDEKAKGELRPKMPPIAGTRSKISAARCRLPGNRAGSLSDKKVRLF
jgi:hypothetical protein